MRKLVSLTFTVASIFFVIFAFGFHSVYGLSKVRKIAFDYYAEGSLLHNLKFLVAFNPLFSVPFNIIIITEIFEKIKMFNPFLRNSDNSLNRRKVLQTRLVLLTCVFIMTLLSTDIAVIFELVGGLFGPILGFILPVRILAQYCLTLQIYFYESYYGHTKRHIPIWRKALHRLFFVAGILFGVCGLYSTFNK